MSIKDEYSVLTFNHLTIVIYIIHHRIELKVFVTNIAEKINAYRNVLNTGRQYNKVRNA